MQPPAPAVSHDSASNVRFYKYAYFDHNEDALMLEFVANHDGHNRTVTAGYLGHDESSPVLVNFVSRWSRGRATSYKDLPKISRDEALLSYETPKDKLKREANEAKRKRIDDEQRNRRTEGRDQAYQQGLEDGRRQAAAAGTLVQNDIEYTILSRFRETRALLARDENLLGIAIQFSDFQVAVARPDGAEGTDTEPGIRWMRDDEDDDDAPAEGQAAQQRRSPSAAPTDTTDGNAEAPTPAGERGRSVSVAASELSNASTLVAAAERLGSLDGHSG